MWNVIKLAAGLVGLGPWGLIGLVTIVVGALAALAGFVAHERAIGAAHQIERIERKNDALNSKAAAGVHSVRACYATDGMRWSARLGRCVPEGRP